jgi:hypothetical protein
MKFLECVSKVINPIVPPNPCPDQWVGVVHVVNGAFKWPESAEFSRRSIDELNKHVDMPRLVIVLESPHIEEYNWDKEKTEWVVVGPANGSAGRNIRQHLAAATRNKTELKDKAMLNLVLVNAVQYQCSLGNSLQTKVNKILRDEVFQECWVNGEADFKTRLSKCYLPGSIVINCCTQSYTTKNGGRKKKVTDAIKAVVQVIDGGVDALVFEMPHPSSRSFGKE